MKPPARKFPGAGFVIFVRNVYLYLRRIGGLRTTVQNDIHKTPIN